MTWYGTMSDETRRKLALYVYTKRELDCEWVEVTEITHTDGESSDAGTYWPSEIELHFRYGFTGKPERKDSIDLDVIDVMNFLAQ